MNPNLQIMEKESSEEESAQLLLGNNRFHKRQESCDDIDSWDSLMSSDSEDYLHHKN